MCLKHRKILVPLYNFELKKIPDLIPTTVPIPTK